MNGKMLIKVTLNEATDPDLFAYLSRFDNARLRAGALRAIARVAVGSDRGQIASPVRAHTDDPVSSSRPAPRSQAVYDNATAMQTSTPPAPPATATGTEPPLASQPLPIAHATAPERRFDTDAIGEQFAEF